LSVVATLRQSISVDVVSKGVSRDSLSERKRKATRDRIAATAAQLVAADGLTSTTVGQIAGVAEVGRATFFRYFSSKEDAIVEGLAKHWLDLITEAVERQPTDLSAGEAVQAAFRDLGEGFAEISDQVRELSSLTRSSVALSAWTLQFYVGYEVAIAELVAPRLSDLRPDDPRPRLLGALAMASVRIALDDWLEHGGSLPDRVRAALASVSVA
jgi:AcrR family transcriptional regulator